MLEDKVILITGASSGFGKSAASLLGGRKEFRVFGSSRSPHSDRTDERRLAVGEKQQ
ncbi:MAG: hypothetical protein OK422_05715 [Thaumarchaeota archaeon]|nr:hypothetical protein [Nitrososphaerota archaeon]